MASLTYRGKINRQLQGKLIRQSTSTRLLNVTWGGVAYKKSKLRKTFTFFHNGIRTG